MIKKLLGAALTAAVLTSAPASPSNAIYCWLSDPRVFDGDIWMRKICVFHFGGVPYSLGYRRMSLF